MAKESLLTKKDDLQKSGPVLSKEYIARSSLVMQEGYPFDHWMFIWDGEVVRVSVNKDTQTIHADFEGTTPDEEVFHIKQFVNKKLEEIYGEAEDRD